MHLHPVDEELWKEDLWWAHSLLERKKAAEEEKARAKEERKRAKIVELDSVDEPPHQLQPYTINQIGSYTDRDREVSTVINSQVNTSSDDAQTPAPLIATDLESC